MKKFLIIALGIFFYTLRAVKILIPSSGGIFLLKKPPTFLLTAKFFPYKSEKASSGYETSPDKTVHDFTNYFLTSI